MIVRFPTVEHLTLTVDFGSVRTKKTVGSSQNYQACFLRTARFCSAPNSAIATTKSALFVGPEFQRGWGCDRTQYQD